MFIVPVNYGYDLTEGQLTLYLHSAREGRKAAAFRRGGAVAFEMDCGHQLMTAEQACSYSCAYRSIMGSGTIRELTEPQEKYEALNAIMRHMTGRNWEMRSLPWPGYPSLPSGRSAGRASAAQPTERR